MLQTLRGPNGSEFTLKIDGEYTSNVETNLVLDTLENAVNEVAGTEFEIEIQTYTIDIAIKGMDTGDYPTEFHDPANSDSHNDSYAYELEYAARNWGLGDNFQGTAELELDSVYGGIPETKQGILRSVTLSKIPNQDNNSDHWQGTIEFTEVQVLY